jgi:hypothetical protein
LAVRAAVAAGLAALLAAVAPATSGHSAATVVVTIGPTSCAVSPRAVTTGAVVFRVVNRSGRTARFVVGGRSVAIGRGRTARLTVALAAGRRAYACTVAGRRVGAGALRVAEAPAVATAHRIGVRVVNDFGELYDRATGATFVPRGNNYIRLGPQVDGFGRTQVYHSTFIVGRYEPERAEMALARMAAGGYNVVRVFLTETCAQGCVVDGTTGEISRPFVANVADFLRRARSHGVFVLLTGEWLPGGRVYDSLIAGVRREWFDHINLLFLSPQGVDASIRFWRDLARALVREQAPLDAVFAYEPWNEATMLATFPPFALHGGLVTAANGHSYDMASADDRKRMIDDGFVHYIDRVREAILQVDPTALVTMGFFHDTEPNPARRGDPRLVRTRAVIERSSADFVDIHPYPGDELTFAQFMANYGIDGPTAKPIVIGEFGAAHFAFPSAAAAAASLVAWQRESCRYGIDGWLLWTWDTEEQPDLWNALSTGGVIERALAPRNRPDPCA